MTRDPIVRPVVAAGRDQRPRQAQSAQRIWRRAASVTGALDEHDVLAVVLELLRAARHDVGTVSEALTIGRRRASERPSDAGVQRGLMFLEHALVFMGVELPTGRR